MRRIASLSAAVLVGGLLAPSSALATGDDEDDERLRWIAVEDHFTVVRPDGQTITEDAPPTEGEDPPPSEGEDDFSPPVGSRVFVSEALHATADGTTLGEEIGRTHIECTVGVVPVTVLCDIAFVLHNGSQLHGAVHVDFSNQSETEQLQFDIAVTGGTDDFSGAGGEVALLDITPVDDPEAEIVTLYEVNID